TIEFPGREDLKTCLERYRGNYGRLLVYVFRDGMDFQDTMIGEGYSPYFVKYGNAVFAGHHHRYRTAERKAQGRRIGVWNPIEVNGGEFRNYAALSIWWQVRATIIDEYRRIRAVDASVLNPRLDYALIKAKAEAGDAATVFTELRTLTRAGGDHGLIGIGSLEQPFHLFIPDIDAPEGQTILNLLETRYISSSTADKYRRSYAYVAGRLSTYFGRPQMIVTSPEQIADNLADRRDDPSAVALMIRSLLPDPIGSDAGFEQVLLANTGRNAADLEGWFLQDRSGHQVHLSGTLAGGEEKEILLQPGKLPLNNTGDEVTLFDPGEKIRHRVTYSAGDVVPGQTILFS
ncbi:MAG: lamin tail domain-containing protein, partial [Thermodesulfobacteriota bacterium]